MMLFIAGVVVGGISAGSAALLFGLFLMRKFRFEDLNPNA